MPKVSAVNTETGEYIDASFNSPEEFKLAWLEIQGLENAVKRLREKLKEHLEKMLGNEDSLDLGGGYRFVRYPIQRFDFDPFAVKSNLPDEDMFMDVAKIDGKKLKDLMAELVQRGELESEASKAILESKIPTVSTVGYKLEKPTKRGPAGQFKK